MVAHDREHFNPGTPVAFGLGGRRTKRQHLAGVVAARREVVLEGRTSVVYDIRCMGFNGVPGVTTVQGVAARHVRLCLR